MALNKSQTSLGVKVVLIVVAIAMVGFLFPAVFSLFNSNDSNANTQNTATGAWDTIAAEYNATVAQNDQALQANPNNYVILVQQGNTYFDWALKVMQASQTNQNLQGSDQPLWLSARQYYERAAAATQTVDAPVQTDLSIAYHYSGETTKAVETVNKVIEANPEFAQAWFNLGVFYQALGRNAEAVAAYEKSVALDPKASSVEFAKQQIEVLGGSATATGTPSP